jgi:polysaccharide biosynthesis transport protein
MELRQYLKILRKYLWMILLVCAIGAGSSYYYSSRQPPIYRSTTTLALNLSAPGALLPYYVQPETVQNLVPTYIEFLHTRAFASSVVAQLNMPDVSEETIMSSIAASGVANTVFFRISVVSSRPDYALRIADAVATSFIEQNVRQQAEQQSQRDTAQTALRDLEKQRLDDLRTRLEEQNKYYTALIPTLTSQIAELDKLPPSNERTQKITDLHAQLVQAQDLNVRVLGSLSDTQTRYQLLSDTGTYNTAIIVDKARLPFGPEPGHLLIDVLFAGVASVILALGGAILLEYLDNTYKTPEELDADYGLPTLGAIGRIVTGGKSRRESGESLVMLRLPNSTLAEAYRSLRTNIQFAAAGKPIRSLLITSAGPAEGKSMTAANLAISFAQLGGEVILADLDLRRPSVHRLFGLSNETGFTNMMLNGHRPLESYLQNGPVAGLRILTSGPLPPNPSELLSSADARALIEQLCGEADLVIFDTAPAVTVTDAVILAAQVDAVLQIVLAGSTRRDLALRGRDILKRSGGRLLGPVLNKIKLGDLGNYYYYYRDYHRTTPRLKESIPLWRRLRPGHGHAEGGKVTIAGEPEVKGS